MAWDAAVRVVDESDENLLPLLQLRRVPLHGDEAAEEVHAQDHEEDQEECHEDDKSKDGLDDLPQDQDLFLQLGKGAEQLHQTEKPESSEQGDEASAAAGVVEPGVDLQVALRCSKHFVKPQRLHVLIREKGWADAGWEIQADVNVCFCRGRCVALVDVGEASAEDFDEAQDDDDEVKEIGGNPEVSLRPEQGHLEHHLEREDEGEDDICDLHAGFHRGAPGLPLKLAQPVQRHADGVAEDDEQDEIDEHLGFDERLHDKLPSREPIQLLRIQNQHVGQRP
mmetsp:Transcript_25943/g.58572  ORF Transcript_25943/g.58572 Transcript_25943/m.58572 type:complete len:281 (-) Transcript_25943:1991-2833(-)